MDKKYIERLNRMLDDTNEKIKTLDLIEDEAEKSAKEKMYFEAKENIEAQLKEANDIDEISQIGVVEEEIKKTKSTKTIKTEINKVESKQPKKTKVKNEETKSEKQVHEEYINESLNLEYVVVNDIKVPVYDDEVMKIRHTESSLSKFDNDHSEFTKEKLAQEKQLMDIYEWDPNVLIDKQEVVKHTINPYEDKNVIRAYSDDNKINNIDDNKIVEPIMKNENIDNKISQTEEMTIEKPIVEPIKEEPVKKSSKEIHKELKAEKKSKENFERIPGEKSKYINVELPEIKDDGIKALKQINKRQKQLTSKYSKQILNGAIVSTTNYEPDVQDHVIELHGVTKSYLTGDVETQVLKGIDIKLNKSDFIVILGPSGSGKTTFLNTISGLDKATKGDVFVLGYNLTFLKDSHLTKFRRKHVGFIFQQYNLLTNLTAKENAEVGENLSTNKNTDMTIEDIFETIGMKEQMNKYPHQMSGGQQQRVSIARALAKNPDILFADEPTGALDEEMGRKVLEILVEVNRKYKTTVIVVTHNPNIAKIGNTVIHIKNGLVDRVINNENPADPQSIDWS